MFNVVGVRHGANRDWCDCTCCTMFYVASDEHWNVTQRLHCCMMPMINVVQMTMDADRGHGRSMVHGLNEAFSRNILGYMSGRCDMPLVSAVVDTGAMSDVEVLRAKVAVVPQYLWRCLVSTVTEEMFRVVDDPL